MYGGRAHAAPSPGALYASPCAWRSMRCGGRRPCPRASRSAAQSTSARLP